MVGRFGACRFPSVTSNRPYTARAAIERWPVSKGSRIHVNLHGHACQGSLHAAALHRSVRFRPWKFVFRALDVVLDESDFHYRICQVAGPICFSTACKEISLLRRNDVGHDDDYASVERLLTVEIKKVGAVVGDKRVLLLADDTHKLPIFQSAQSTVTDMVCAVARRIGDGGKGCVQAFVNQKLHVGVASEATAAISRYSTSDAA